MRVNSIKRNEDRSHLSITFCNENEEREFLRNMIEYFGKLLPVNCMLTDLDTSYSAYEQYFPRGNHYVIDHVTSASILAFELNHTEIQDVISNWGYYTFAAIFSLGVIRAELKKQELDYLDELKSMSIVVSQVLDTSLEINIENRFFEEMLKFVVNN